MVVLAQEEARSLKHNYIGTEHILLGLLREQDGLAACALESLDITVERVRTRVVRIVGSGEEVAAGQIPFTPRAKKVLELALHEALSLAHNYIGTEHILLGLTAENEGVAARILADCGADANTIRDEVIRRLESPQAREQPRSMPTTTVRNAGDSPPQMVDQSWFGGLGAVLDELAAEIRRELQRPPDTGDLLLALASAPNALAAQVLRELGVNLEGLPDVVKRLRAQALAADELAQRLRQLTEAKQQALETVAQLRAEERELRAREQARAAIAPDVLHDMRRQLGIPTPIDPPHPPPEAS